MTNRTKFGFRDFFYIAIMLAWIAAYTLLLTGDRYVLFIEKDLKPLLIIALVVSVLFSISLIVKPSGRSNGKSPLAILFNTGLLLLPLIYMYSVPSNGLDSYARMHRVPYVESTLHDKGRPATGRDTSYRLPDNDFSADENTGFVYDVNLTEIETGIDSLAGRNIRTIGRVSRDTVLPDGYFFVFRFVITCCAAHAMPMSLPVVENDMTSSIPNDAWIEITGTVYPEKMNIGKFVFDSIPVIYSEKVRKIEAPQNPYISSR
jgi:uncharacterized repeat protein (TIGR03943 family)